MNTMNGIMVANFDGANPNQAYFVRNLWRNITGQNRAAAQATADAASRAAADARAAQELAETRAAEAARLKQQQIDEHNRQMQALMEQQRQLASVVAPVRERALAIAGSTQNLVIIGIICAVAIWYFFIRKKK